MQDKCDFNYLITKATRLIMRRLHSKHEIYQKLYKICQDDGLINNVLKELKYLNLINDKIFAESYASELFTKKYGIHKIRQKLYARGIEKEQIITAIQDTIDTNNINSLDIIKELLEKKALDLSNYNDRTKAVRFLLNRGFDMRDIYQVVGEDKIEY